MPIRTSVTIKMSAAPAAVLIRLLLIAQFLMTVAFSLSPAAGAAPHELVSAVQDPPDDEENEVNPTRLWELCPLNPNPSGEANPIPSTAARDRVAGAVALGRARHGHP